MAPAAFAPKHSPCYIKGSMLLRALGMTDKERDLLFHLGDCVYALLCQVFDNDHEDIIAMRLELLIRMKELGWKGLP